VLARVRESRHKSVRPAAGRVEVEAVPFGVADDLLSGLAERAERIF
jgi:hypothetical protein